MSVELSELVNYCNTFLNADQFRDYCPNGLQIEGKKTVNNIISGVTASQMLIEKAIEKKADLLLVHHGYFWKGDDPCIVSFKQSRIKALLQHDISLLSYHLPLDAHPTLGNNVQLAKQLGISITGEFDTDTKPSLGLTGTLPKPMSAAELGDLIQQKLQRSPLIIQGHDRNIKTIAWCTGAAQDFIFQAAQSGVDAYLSGEISERTTHLARELGITYFAAGHHATERYGVKLLGEQLADHFSLNCEFIDVDNPI